MMKNRGIPIGFALSHQSDLSFRANPLKARLW